MNKFVSKLAPAIKEYLELRNTLGYSNRQEEHLSMLDDYYHKYHPDLETMTKESVRGWLSYEISRGRTGMYNKIGSIRMFARYMGNGAYVLPIKAVPGQSVCTPYIMTDDELSRFFTASENIKGRTSKTIKLMAPTLLRLLYTCGLRPPEVRLIKRENVNFLTGEILIEKTKGHAGHKERIIVMSDDMLRQCRKYDIVRNITSPASEYFFARSDGAPMPNYQLSGLINVCWRQANPDIPSKMLPRVRPYDLRHRFASMLLQKWLSERRDLYAMLPYMRAYMGHESFSATAYYIHMLPDNLLHSPGVDWNAIDAVNPEVSVWNV